MPSKKSLKIFGLSAVALLGLTACGGTITAHPSTYKAELIASTEYTDKIYNNVASVVYDAVEKNGIGSDVLNEILYLYAVTTFGPYDATVKAAGVPVALGQITLSEAAADQTKIAAFIKAHKVYWDSDRRDETADVTETEKARVITKVSTIKERIAEKMYNKISGGSYSDRHIFSEAKFLKELRKNFYNVADPDTAGTDNLYTGTITPDVEPKDVFVNDQGIGYLHLKNYMDEANTYIVDEIMPEIYREFLNELYVLEESESALRNSIARNVNIIEIKYNENYPNASYYLADTLVKELNNPDHPVEDVLKRFKDYSKAYLGTTIDSTTSEILNEAGKNIPETDDKAFTYNYTGGVVGSYYTGTEYGDLAKKYIKMIEAKTVDTSAENSFTSSGVYPTYVGLDLKKKELDEKDYVTSGWFIKNGGLASLPSAIRERLFNIAVGTSVKETEADREKASRKYVDGHWEEAEGESTSYIVRVNGHNYLKKDVRVKGERIENDILHYDSSSKSYYIIEVLEATTTSKLNPASSYSYTRTRGADVMERIINEANHIVAAGGSYSSLSAKKYLKAMNIQYHDTDVYTYFVNNYPELFE